MPTPFSANTFRVACEGDLLGDRWANVFHFRSTGALGTSEIDQAFNALESFYNALKSRLTNQWDLDRLVATAYLGADSYSVERTPASAIVGGSSLTPLPPDVALCISWRTPFIGRSRRGRTYLPGWTQGDLAGAGVASSATRTQVATAITALSGLSLIDLGVYSRVLNQFTTITGYYVDDQFDTQRRRGKSQPRQRTAGTVTL